MAGNARLWLRWSWRDLRRRWTAVVAIAAVIALGTGTYAGLLSTSAWRTQSNDESFAMLDVHDLRVELPSGTTFSVRLGQMARLGEWPDGRREPGPLNPAWAEWLMGFPEGWTALEA